MGVGPNSNDTGPYKIKPEGDLRHRRRPYEDRQRRVRQTQPRNSGGPPEAGSIRGGFTPRAFGGSPPLPML